MVAQDSYFETTEHTLSSAVQNLSANYKNKQLRVDQSKTQVSLFHRRNKQARRKLKITCEELN